jgi:branched-chain amino acid transport system substrate-binding protein
MRALGLGILVLLLVSACAVEQAPQEDKPVKIGVLASVSGPAAVYGEAFIKGVNQALTEINANGTKIEIVVDDNKNDPREGVVAYQRVRLQDPDIVLSSMSGATVAITPLVKDDGKPLVGTLSVTRFNNDYDNSFRYFINGEDNAEALATFLKERGIKSVGIYVTNSEAGINAMKPVEERLAKEGITIVAKEPYDPATTDHRTALLKIAGKKPEALYVWAIRPDQVVGEAKSAFNGQIIFNEIPGVSRFYLKDDRFEGVYLMLMAFAVPGTSENEKFNAKFGEEQNGYAAFGYDIMHIINDALANGATPETLVQQLNSVDSYQGLVGDVAVNQAMRDTNVPMVIMKVQGKAIVAAD